MQEEIYRVRVVMANFFESVKYLEKSYNELLDKYQDLANKYNNLQIDYEKLNKKMLKNTEAAE